MQLQQTGQIADLSPYTNVSMLSPITLPVFLRTHWTPLLKNRPRWLVYSAGQEQFHPVCHGWAYFNQKSTMTNVKDLPVADMVYNFFLIKPELGEFSPTPWRQCTLIASVEWDIGRRRDAQEGLERVYRGSFLIDEVVFIDDRFVNLVSVGHGKIKGDDKLSESTDMSERWLRMKSRCCV